MLKYIAPLSKYISDVTENCLQSLLAEKFNSFISSELSVTSKYDSRTGPVDVGDRSEELSYFKPWVGSLWHKRAGIATLWKYFNTLKLSTNESQASINESGPCWMISAGNIVLPVTDVVVVVVSQAWTTLSPGGCGLGTLVIHWTRQGGGEVTLSCRTDKHLLHPLTSRTSRTSRRPTVTSNGHQSL